MFKTLQRASYILAILSIGSGLEGVDLTGRWRFDFEVVQAGGECEGSEGEEQSETLDLVHNTQTNEVTIKGVVAGDFVEVAGSVSLMNVPEMIEYDRFGYSLTFRDGSGWTNRVLEVQILNNDSMSGTEQKPGEDWNWGPSPGVITCPNSVSSVTATRLSSPGDLQAASDRFRVPPGSSDVVLDVLVNDVGESLSIVGLGVEGGTGMLNAVGSEGGALSSDGSSVRYTPLADFKGTEFFVYDVESDSQSGSATVWVTVSPSIQWGQPILGYADGLGRAMGQSDLGRRLLELIGKYHDELFGIAYANPEIGGEISEVASALSSLSSQKKTGSARILSAVVGNGGEISATFDALSEGLASFMSGSGSGSIVTVEAVAQAAKLRDLVKAAASDELKADIDAELGNIESQAGKTYEQFLGSFGAQPSDVSLFVFDPMRGGIGVLVASCPIGWGYLRAASQPYARESDVGGGRGRRDRGDW